MDITIYASKKKEATLTIAADRSFSWLRIKPANGCDIDFHLDCRPHNLVFLDQLRYAVDQAIRFTRSGEEK